MNEQINIFNNLYGHQSNLSISFLIPNFEFTIWTDLVGHGMDITYLVQELIVCMMVVDRLTLSAASISPIVMLWSRLEPKLPIIIQTVINDVVQTLTDGSWARSSITLLQS